MSKTVFDMHGELPWDNKFRALLSAPYVTGVVLHDRKCWFEQFAPGRISDPDLDAFIRSRISVSIDDKVKGTGAAIMIELKDGRTFSDRRAHPHGDAADPLSRAEIVEKFRQSADGLLLADVTERAIDLLIGIETLENVTTLTALLGAPDAALA